MLDDVVLLLLHAAAMCLQVVDALEDVMTAGGCLVDYHSCDFFPERRVFNAVVPSLLLMCTHACCLHCSWLLAAVGVCNLITMA